MKHLLYAIFTIISLTACSQTKKVPQNILNVFSHKFPDAKEIEWGKEDENTWEAEFELSDKDMSANFNIRGVWLETETELTKKDLPKVIKNVISTDYKGYKIKEMGFTETPNYKAFEVEVKKGAKVIELVIDGSGKIIETKAINKEKDND